jgi:site-specific recombinase XerD
LKKHTEYLFTSIRGNKPLRYKNLNVLCKKLSEETGISFTAHCLRHTFGSVSIEQGIGLVQLKEIMGHSDISSTMIYLKMSSKGLKESINKIELF